MRYKIQETGEWYEEIDDVLDRCIEDDYHEDDDYFEEWLNEIYSGVEICGTYYSPYTILDNAGDGNLDDALRDFCESQNDNDRENGDWELRRAHNGDEIYIQAYTVEVYDDIDETGDYDGDEEFDIENLRRIVEEQQQEDEEEKNNEKDIMSLFQHIGG